MLRLLLTLTMTSVLTCPSVHGLFEWLKPKDRPPPPEPAVPAHLDQAAGFEMSTEDQRFVLEAKHLELSPLDSCQQQVVVRLRESCGGLSEEQLAKLGVELFNCQAQSEGRPTYPCTQEMSIRACTAGMDSDTWNAYLIVSNRARSVCYAARQQLFRRRAELTVNALISTASSQLDTMKDLKEGQSELKALTSASLERLLQGHSALQDQQGRLYQGQEQMESSLKENLDRLGQEKALIASGQDLVAQLIKGITQKIENLSQDLQVQGSEVQENHHAVVKDLTNVRHQAQDVYQRIDHSLTRFVGYQDQTVQYYLDLMDKLERMNSTLGFVMLHMDHMQTGIEERLHMIQGYLGWAGLSLTHMWTCVVHAVYFLLVAVVLTFLGCPGFSRAMLLLTVPLNAVAEVQQQAALDLKSLTLLLTALTLGHWFLTQFWTWFLFRGKSDLMLSLPPCDNVKPPKASSTSCPSFPASSTPEKCENELLDSLISGHPSVSAVSWSHRNSGSGSSLCSPKLESWSGLCSPKPRPPLAPVDVLTPKNLRVVDSVNDSRCSTPGSGSPSVINNSCVSVGGRQLCSGITKTGKVCKKRAMSGQEFCRIHEGGLSSYVHF